MQYLNDRDFLNKLDNIPIKVQYIELTMLTFDERPIKSIKGMATSGSIAVSANSKIRRTLNLSMRASHESNDLTDLENLVSLNKKVKVKVGYKNPLREYAHYGETVWFPCGVFVLSNASLTRSTSGYTISLSGKDKMVMLDGSVGGTLPATAVLHEIYEYDEEDELIVTAPTIYRIIFEAVTHLAEEVPTKVFINDLEETVKLLVKYAGDTPIWFANDYSSFIITEKHNVPGFELNRYSKGNDIGYMQTPFTYPGELVLNAGESVSAILDKICNALGNYEYFYDVDGNFIFQEIKNYLNNSYTPITDVGGDSYIKAFSNNKYAYSMADAKNIVSITNNPNYDNIKNDFIVWGCRSSGETEIPIRYHLAVDEKPSIFKASQYMWAVKKDEKTILRYEYTLQEKSPAVNAGETIELISTPCEEWREELYRNALEGNLTATPCTHYDPELIAEWRFLFDPMSDDFKKDWEALYDSTWLGWNPEVRSAPHLLSYWLDFIDTGSVIGAYSISAIGRRSKVVNESAITSIYNMEFPDVMFIENPKDASERSEAIQALQSVGQSFCLLSENHLEYFQTSATGASAYDNVRELLYQHLTYNAQISLTCLPRYYLEPNSLIYLNDKQSGVNGNFVITQFTLPLTHSGTMSITATEALTRV